MAFAYADVPNGAFVSPYIGGAAGSAVVSSRSAGRADDALFPKSVGMGGTSVRGADAPARQGPGRPDNMAMPTMDHVVDTAQGHVDNGVTGLGNFLGGAIDNASQFGVGTMAVTSALGQMGISALQNSLTTQGPSYTFGDVQPPQQDMNPGQNAALMEAMHWATRMKAQGLQLDGDFSTASLGDLKEVATNPQAQEFAMAKQQQAAGVGMA